MNFEPENMMSAETKRDEWTVQYTGSALAKAAADKKTYHEGRLKWWRHTKEEVAAAIRAGGITVTESIVDDLAKQGYTNTTRGDGGPVVQIDAAMQAHLREAHGKVKDHEKAVSVYDAWHQMMSSEAATPRTFELTQADWMFFFGK